MREIEAYVQPRHKLNVEINKNTIEISRNAEGRPGRPGPPGPAGNGIAKIEKTSTSGIVDTYTIFFTNGSTFSYDIVNGIIYYYDGPYDVIPMPHTAQILPTANLAMSDNVNIQEIPYYEVSNSSGGYTATIGDIN